MSLSSPSSSAELHECFLFFLSTTNRCEFTFSSQEKGKFDSWGLRFSEPVKLIGLRYGLNCYDDINITNLNFKNKNKDLYQKKNIKEYK